MSKAKFIESTKRILDHYLVDYELVDEEKGLFHCRNCVTNELVQYYSGTGTIVDIASKGIYNLLDYLGIHQVNRGILKRRLNTIYGSLTQF